MVPWMMSSMSWVRVAGSIPAGGPLPAQLAAARDGVLKSLADLEAIAPADSVFLDAIRAVRIAVGSVPVARRDLPAPVQSQTLPTGDIEALLALASMAAQLFQGLRTRLKQAGATPEQFAALDAQLSDDITRLEGEVAAEQNTPQA